jgi:hypothetical protein
MKLRPSSPTAGWWKCLTAVAWKRTLCAAQWVRNASLCVASSPTSAVPVGVERLGARFEEDEPRVVRRPHGCGVELGEQRAPKVVGGEDVEAVIADVGGSAGDRVECPLDLRPDAWLVLAPARACPGRLGGAGEVEDVGALGVVELERPGQCLQDALGGAAHVSAFKARVVLDAHAGPARRSLRGAARERDEHRRSTTRLARA